MNKYKGARTAFLKGANNDICRLCLAGRGELSDLFKNEPKETGIRIFHCTQIKLKYIAGLPSAICESCKSELVIASNFRKRCLESDEFLRKVYPHLFEDDMQKPEPKSKIDPQNSLEVQLLDLESFNNYDDNQAQYEILLKEEGVEEVEDVVEEQQEDAGEEDGEEDGEANFKVERRYSREHIFLDRNEEDYANYYDEGSTEGHNENTNEDDEQSRTETEYVTYSRSNYEEDEAEENELNPEQRSDDPQEEEEGDEEVEEEEDHDKEDESDPEFKIPKTQIRKRRKSSVTKGANIGKRRKFNKTDAKNNDQGNDKKRKKTPCHICGILQTDIKQHMLIHSGVKSHVCPFCNMSFRHRCNLNNHVNRHTGKKPYKCKECDMAYSDPASLKCHALKHLPSRNFVCLVCDKKFFTDKFLEIHMRIHKEREFKCEYCEKGFYRRTELKIHVRNHTGERPFACDKCPKKFAKKSYLNQHLWTHSKEKPFKCTMCDKSFTFKTAFTNHVNSAHFKTIKTEEAEEMIEIDIKNDPDDSESMKEVYLEVEDWEVFQEFEKEISDE